MKMNAGRKSIAGSKYITSDFMFGNAIRYHVTIFEGKHRESQ